MSTLNPEVKIFGAKKRQLSFKQKVWKFSVIERMNNPLGYSFLAILMLAISVAIVYAGPISAILILAVVVGLPMMYAVIVYPKFGIITLLIGSYLIMLVDKLADGYPIGTLMDGLEALLVIGFAFKHKYDKNWDFLKNPISIIIIIWIAYNFLEVLNPDAESRLAWVFTVRTVAIVMLTYFIFMYHVKSVSFIRLILKLWIGLSVFAALYSFKQEYFDFFPFEKNWLAMNPTATSLYFINNHWRKFSIFSDPVASAYNMVISSLLCIALMFGPIAKPKKLLLGAFTAIFIMAMLHSGTRGAFVLIPAGLGMLFVLKMNKKLFLLTVAITVAFIIVIKLPTSNESLARFQSAFNPSKDASYTVRVINQKRIQPYIQSHPLGGGLGATGTWGQRFSPNSYLASFPPDSGFVRVAVEGGWIGLLLICTLLFIILKTGIENYFKIKDPELKNYCLAMVIIVFALNVGNFPQEALVQYPINVYFYLVAALINITLKIDREQNNVHSQINVKAIHHDQ